MAVIQSGEQSGTPSLSPAIVLLDGFSIAELMSEVAYGANRSAPETPGPGRSTDSRRTAGRPAKSRPEVRLRTRTAARPPAVPQGCLRESARSARATSERGAQARRTHPGDRRPLKRVPAATAPAEGRPLGTAYAARPRPACVH